MFQCGVACDHWPFVTRRNGLATTPFHCTTTDNPAFCIIISQETATILSANGVCESQK